MRVLVSTEIFLSEKDSFIKGMKNFDETFSKRYCEEWDLGEFGKSINLSGEIHWEADKYHIFYLDVEEEKVAEFIEFSKSHEDCETVLEVDGDYKMIGEEPLFSRREKLPQNLTAREDNFKARVPEPGM